MKKTILSILLAAVSYCSIAQTVPFYIPSNGLVGWWPFNGNANDESGNGNNGVINGATLTSDRKGNANSAYSFSNNEIVVNSSPSLGFAQSAGFTISFWVYKTGSQNIMHFAGKRGDNTNAHNWQVFEALPNLGFGCGGGGVVTASNLTLNNWFHFVAIYANGTRKIYVNGSLLISAANSGYDGDANVPVKFGTSGNYPGLYGNLDDIGIWSRALTAQEISSLYHSGVVPPINLTTTNITSFGAKCNWSSVSNATNYQVRYHKVGTATWTYVNSAVINKTLSGIDSTTQYEWNVKSYVSSTWSAWSVKKKFTTKGILSNKLENENSDINSEVNIEVFPNPNTGNFTIDFGKSLVVENHSILIRNVLSQTIFETKTNQQKVEVNLNGIVERGIYFLEIRNDKNEIIRYKKLIVG